MLKQGSIRQIQNAEITRQDGYIVATMAFYPRGMKKDLLDEYRSELAPSKELLKDFKQHQSEGHEIAFEKSKYEERFELSRRATDSLKVLAEMSRNQDVFLICQCDMGEKCHREILLLIAQKEFGAQIGTLSHSYPIFEQRLNTALGNKLKLS